MVPTKQQIDNMQDTSTIKNCDLGNNFVYISPVNLYDIWCKDDVFIGPFVEIQSKVVIGNRTRVQSHSFICSHVQIGDDCFIGHGVMFVNDLMREDIDRTGNSWKLTFIENNVRIGSNATILPVLICNNVTIGAGAVVTKNILEPGIYAGNPAKLLRKI